MSHVDTLRRAATLMRERAEAATPGPWAADPDTTAGRVWVRFDWRGDMEPVTLPPHDIAIQRGDIAKRRLFEVRSRRDSDAWQDTRETVYRQRASDAQHIASWHPAVALAVADWLDDEADWLESNPPIGWRGTASDRALAVARAYLGEEES